MDLHEDDRNTLPGRRREAVAAVLLVFGAFAVVIAGTDSVVFDLERHLAPKTLALHVTALLLILTGIPTFRSLRPPPGAGPSGLPALLLSLFVVWGAVSSIFAANPWLALRGWGVSFSSLILFLAARRLAPRYRWRIVAGILGAAVLGAAFGVAQAYGVDWTFLAESRAPGGTFGNRNFLAHLSAIALGPMMVATARSRGRWLPGAVLGVAILVAAIVLTRSRAAWLGAAVSLAATLLTLVVMSRGTGTPRPWGRLLVATLFVGVAAATAVALPNQLRWSSDAPYARTLERLGEYREGSGAGRIVQYRNSLELVAKRPVFGVGPGNWFVHYPRVTERGDPSFSTHLTIPTNPWPSSDWVAFVTERGPLGALLLFLAGASAVFAALRRRRGPAGDGEAPDTHARTIVVATLVAALVTGMFDAVLLLAAPSYVVWTLVGLTLPDPAPAVAGAEGAPREAAPSRASKGARWAVRGAAVAVTLALVVHAGGETAALVLTRHDGGTRALSRAARAAPGEHRLHLLLAERGRCAHARKAAALMPFHDSAAELARRCGD